MKQKIDNINKNFIACFNKKQYQAEPSVKITSSIDPSVVFIGSAISVLKPIILEHRINENGNAITQRAIRTRPLKRIMIPEILEWSSYFNALGLITNYNKLENIIYDSLCYLKEYEGISYSDMQIRISSSDLDLKKAINTVNPGVDLAEDTMPINYYRHKYGLDNYGIYGRNFNIAIKNSQNSEHKDIGNIIVIENKEQKFAVEFAFGANALIMRKENITSSIEASSIADIIYLESPEKYKFADCISVVAHLAYENVEAIKSDRSKIYLFRKYLKALKYWQQKLNISDEMLLNIIEKYINLEYNSCNKEELCLNLKLTRN